MAKEVLIIDDDEGILALLEATIDRAGYTVLGVEDAKKALTEISKKPYGVVVSDIMMPGMDGLALLSEIKKINPDSQVIMVTAHASLDSAIAAIKNGAFGYIRKPFDPHELISQVNNAYLKYEDAIKNKELITDLKKAKEYSDEIINSLVYTVIVVDAGGNIKKVNRAMENILGYKEEEIIGKPANILFCEDYQKKQWNDLILQDKVTDYPMVFRSKAGEKIKAEFTGKIMKDEDGKMIGFIGTAKPLRSK